ncbi:hypothetical protein BDN71DRAFT_1397385 [Pleurotus eryngii]|uniref:CBM1 domain-containing protein n=1 Tax=Pleurotus eryngii TaxID=5323 RepID=A0A9P6D5M8_PLEER|nr:hypothetical protein BDN71DRAFT_1397385 [Pleurotus eryngii]
MIRIKGLSVALFVLAPVALAQQVVWGQCGGNGWAGATTCVTGSTCTVQNEWYSQCIPGTAPPASSTSLTVTPPPTSTSTSSDPSSTPIAGLNYWFSFGDSYTQTGFDPNGVLPSPGNVLGNPPFPGWTSTGGGPNWVGFGATTYNKSQVMLYNYAYGGATIDSALVAPYDPSVISLKGQVDQYLAGAATKPPSTPWTSANSLFSIWIGINDLGGSYYQGGDRAAFSDTLLDAEFALVQKLVRIAFFDTGARNFLFAFVPPTDRSPLMLGQSTDAQALLKTVIGGFNTKLAAKAAAFKESHTGVQNYIWDASATFTKILDAPAAYGFTDVLNYGSAPGLFWTNDLHPTSEWFCFVLRGDVWLIWIVAGPVHKVCAQDVAAVLASTIW